MGRTPIVDKWLMHGGEGGIDWSGAAFAALTPAGRSA